MAQYRYHEGRFKRWARVRFASEEARMDLPKSRAENAILGMRMAIALVVWFLASELSSTGAWAFASMAWAGFFVLVAWTGLTDFASEWERERLLSKRDEDHEEHKEAIAKGNAIFNDVTCDIDEREAARKMVKNLKSIAKADDDTFDKAVRKELLRDE